MTDEYEKLLDELALVYARAAVDAFLRGEQISFTNEKPPVPVKRLAGLSKGQNEG